MFAYCFSFMDLWVCVCVCLDFALVWIRNAHTHIINLHLNKLPITLSGCFLQNGNADALDAVCICIQIM